MCLLFGLYLTISPDMQGMGMYMITLTLSGVAYEYCLLIRQILQPLFQGTQYFVATKIIS